MGCMKYKKKYKKKVMVNTKPKIVDVKVKSLTRK